MHISPVHFSLAYLKANGYKVSVFCANVHGAQIDLDKAIERFGPDFRIVDNRAEFLASFRCKTCGQPAHDINLAPPNGYG